MPRPRPQLTAAHRLCWAACVAAAVYLVTVLGTDALTRNPLAIAGLLLLGIGLLREARRRVPGPN